MLTSVNNILYVFTLLKYIRTGGTKPPSKMQVNSDQSKVSKYRVEKQK